MQKALMGKEEMLVVAQMERLHRLADVCDERFFLAATLVRVAAGKLREALDLIRSGEGTTPKYGILTKQACQSPMGKLQEAAPFMQGKDFIKKKAANRARRRKQNGG